MKLNAILTTLVISGVACAGLLTGCGGGGSASNASVSTTPTTPTTPTTTSEVPWTLTSLDAITASVKVGNSMGVDLPDVQVVVSALNTIDTSSDGSAVDTTAKGVVLFNSLDDAASSQVIANGSNHTFGLRNVSFSLASSDTSSTASESSCSSGSDKALGEVLLEVFSQNNLLKSEIVSVCALQGLVYSVDMKS